MSEKESKFDRDVTNIRQEHEYMSGGLELARSLQEIGDRGREGILERTERRREAIRALDLTDEEKAQHLDTMTDEVIMPELSSQQQKDDSFVRERQIDYDKNIERSSRHYEKHKQEYLDAALRDATEAGVPVSSSEANNLAEIHDPQSIYPGLTEDELAHLQHLDETLGTSYVKSLLRMSEHHYIGITTPESVEMLPEFLRIIEVNAQIRRAMLEKHPAKKFYERPGEYQHELNLEDVPLLSERLKELGLNDEQQAAIFSSWASYQPIPLVLDESKHKAIRGDDAERIAASMANYLCSELGDLTEFVELYGPEETAEIINTFGIHHFGRYEPEQLHYQLINWHDPGLVNPMRNIIISPHDDWNAAMGGTGKAVGAELARENTVFFEAGSATEIARHIVAVGNRERRAKRDPEQFNLVENVIITGHGTPEKIVLGPEETGISLDMYAAAEEGREKVNGKINTYRRHLGSKFQVILDSCSTAGATLRGGNIATEISDSHDALVHASPATVYGASKQIENGEVVYRISPKNAWVTAARYDGRHGDGVTESSPFRTRLVRWAHFLMQ
ncbi:MAG: hypothetical protein U0526_00505 [Candidatus Saccharibacteria bacterium]